MRVHGRGRHRVDQPDLRIHADMRLHTEIPLVALAGLVRSRDRTPSPRSSSRTAHARWSRRRSCMWKSANQAWPDIRSPLVGSGRTARDAPADAGSWTTKCAPARGWSVISSTR
jgi:hypothetical protein